MDNFSLACSLCEQKYDEDCLPRILKCGHSVCSACVKDRLTKHGSCPECREKYSITTPKDTPINYPLASFISSLSSGQIKFPKTPLPFAGEVVDEDLVKGIGNCPGHGGVITALCVSCSMWVCLDCLVIEHRTSPRGSCKILDIRDAMKQIKLEHQKRSDVLLGKVNSMKRKLEEEDSDIPKFCCLEKNIYHRRLAAKIDMKLKDLINKEESVAKQFVSQLDQVSSSRDKATLTVELTNSCEELLKCQADFDKYLNEKDKRKGPVQEDILRHLRMDIQHLVRESKKPLYVSHKEGRKSKWAPIIPRNKGLLVYSLRDGRPPQDGIVFPLTYVRDLVRQSDPMVFLEVAIMGKPKGVAYVQLFGKSVFCKDTMQVFLGENGHCYKNTKFFFVSDENVLHGGDFVNNDGSGLTFRGDDIYDDDYSSLTYRRIRGLLEVDNCSLCQLYFNLEPTVFPSNSPVGVVVQGLDILEAASRVKPIKRSSISECGLFCPLRY